MRPSPSSLPSHPHHSVCDSIVSEMEQAAGAGAERGLFCGVGGPPGDGAGLPNEFF